MTTPRLTRDMARQFLHDDTPPEGLMEAMEALAYGEHEAIDTATHESVEKADLERLRADARRLDWMERRLLSVEKFEFDGIRSVWELQPLRDDGFTCSDEKVIKAGLRDAIDAAQQEQTNDR